jgi:transcriptional regulator GlxA family with amidase domain
MDPADVAVMRALALYVAEHYASDLRMPDLASHVHVSVRTLQNLFHSHCGEPPLKALRRFRLHQLNGLVLDRPWTPLRELYRLCGLTGSVADRDFFLEIYGLTIREHQEGARLKSTPVPSPSALTEFPKGELRHMLKAAA